MLSNFQIINFGHILFGRNGLFLRRTDRREHAHRDCSTLWPMADRMRQEIEATRCLHAQSTTRNCITAVNAFERFVSEEHPEMRQQPVTAITDDLIRHFAVWNTKRGIRENTIACYMRSLRSVINRITGDGNGLFSHVRTSNVRTVKKAITVGEVRKIATLQVPEGGFPRQARDIFLFCLYASGMPLIDAAHIRKSQLRDGCITYYRHKTHNLVNVRVHRELEQLIRSLSPKDSSYLLPILNDGPEDNGRQYRRFYQRYSRALKYLSNRLDMEGTITSYTPRHTWASLAFEIGNGLNPIGQALGHTNTNTTLAYIKEINGSQVDEVNKSVISYINGHKPLKKYKILDIYDF